MRSSRISLHGIHHVAVLTADAPRAARLYREVLGLHGLDRTRAYRGDAPVRAAFGDDRGRPGSIVQLIEDPAGRPGVPGPGFAHELAWRVADADSLEFWRHRLRFAGFESWHAGADHRGPRAIAFRDADGLAHRLVVDRSGDAPLLANSADIPVEHAIRGIEGVRAVARDWVASADILAGRMDFNAPGVGSFEVRGARTGTYAYEPARAHEARGAEGVGLIHHVAWLAEEGDLRIWRERVIGMGMRVSPLSHHERFRSFSFREPAGVRFEIASPGPPVPSAEDAPTEEIQVFAP